MKKLLSVLLSFMIIFTSIPTYAYQNRVWYEMMGTFDENGDLHFNYEIVEIGNYVAVRVGEHLGWVEYLGTDTDLVIPDEITGISEFLNLPNRKAITSIRFNDNMNGIGDSISGMTSLKEVHFSNGLKEIYGGAFMSCSSLEVIDLPDTVMGIGDNAFQYCTSLKRIELPKGLTRLGNMAFDRCGVTEVVIPSGIVELEWAFSNCEHLEKIVITSPETQTKFWSKFTYPTATIYLPKGSVSYDPLTKAGLNCKIIGLNQTKLTLTKGQRKTLSFNCEEPAESWKSSNPTIVTVDQNGKLTAKANGTATVTATLYGKEYSCKVTVSAKAYTVKRGDTLWGIAARELGDGRRYTEIMELNGLRSTLIHRGKKLYLPE